MEKLLKKINFSYARYIKSKRADRYTTSDEDSYASRHSKKVTARKRFILRLVILLIILMIVWPVFHNGLMGNSKISLQKDGKQKQGDKPEQSVPVMMKPRLYGYDDNNEPYNITADSSVSISETKMILSNLNGQMRLKDDSQVVMHSLKGDYAPKKKELILNGGVKIITDKNYEFNTNSALVKLNENTVTGNEKVHITGLMGDTDANGFIIRNSGDEIFLSGGVNLDAIVSDEQFDRMDEIKEGQKAPGAPPPAIDLKQAIQPKRGEPLNIKSETLVIENKENLAIFTKKVHATQGQMILNADEMIVHTEYDEKLGKNRFSLIEASGNVDFKSLQKTARSKKARYDVNSGILILTEDVRMADGDNSMEGKYFRYNAITGVSELRNTSELTGKAGGKTATDTAKPEGRVKASFVPGSDREAPVPFAIDKDNQQINAPASVPKSDAAGQN